MGSEAGRLGPACHLLYGRYSLERLKKAMSISLPRSPARPARDEWGVYDPQQAGLVALFARLDSKDAKAKADDAAVTAPALPRPALRDAK